MSMLTFWPIISSFKAEDGIRVTSVTGVQTCALPICAAPEGIVIDIVHAPGDRNVGQAGAVRSEERRVGKEGRSRGSPYHSKKKRAFFGGSRFPPVSDDPRSVGHAVPFAD